jgi:hypothetical protein
MTSLTIFQEEKEMQRRKSDLECSQTPKQSKESATKAKSYKWVLAMSRHHCGKKTDGNSLEIHYSLLTVKSSG